MNQRGRWELYRRNYHCPPRYTSQNAGGHHVVNNIFVNNTSTRHHPSGNAHEDYDDDSLAFQPRDHDDYGYVSEDNYDDGYNQPVIYHQARRPISRSRPFRSFNHRPHPPSVRRRVQHLRSPLPGPVRLLYAPPAMRQVEYHGQFCMEAVHCQPTMDFYEVTFHDGTCHLVAIQRGMDELVAARAFELWHDARSGHDGICMRFAYLRNVVPFATTAGPLALQCRSHLSFCAALLACQLAFGPGYFMCQQYRRCQQWARSPAHHGHYDRAMTVAAVIVKQLNLPNGDPTIRPLTVNDIMSFDVYNTYRSLVKKLRDYGVTSELGRGVDGARAIMDGVYLPTFLFVDSLLPDECWRDNLGGPNSRRWWISNQETQQIHNNSRLRASTNR
jgi:hypothetical protein